MNGPDKLEHCITVGWKGMPETNTLAYLAHLQVTKKMKFWKYVPRRGNILAQAYAIAEEYNFVTNQTSYVLTEDNIKDENLENSYAGIPLPIITKEKKLVKPEPETCQGHIELFALSYLRGTGMKLGISMNNLRSAYENFASFKITGKWPFHHSKHFITSGTLCFQGTTTLTIMPFSIRTFSMMTPSIKNVTFSIMTLSISRTLLCRVSVLLCINYAVLSVLSYFQGVDNTQYNNIQNNDTKHNKKGYIHNDTQYNQDIVLMRASYALCHLCWVSHTTDLCWVL
jgi:hypothetical protein